MIKITPKIISIPPHLSTTWAQVKSIYSKENNLIVSLTDGAVITIPDLSRQDREAIFAAHTSFLEKQQKAPSSQEHPQPVHLFQAISNPAASEGEVGAALRFSLDNMETFSSVLHHNSTQSHMPDLPGEILNKISAIAKIVAPEDIQNMPKPEPHCNCPHCQIARAIQGKLEAREEKIEEIKEEEVSDEELTFQQWDITQTGEKLFSVTNRLDRMEKYSVYLGHPVGCTCGKQGCEHILAVLKS